LIKNEILESIDKCVLCWLATANDKGAPNVSPKEIFCFYNDHLLIANIASPGSAKNIGLNNKVTVSFIDILEQVGFQLKGIASVVKEGSEEFPILSKPLKEMTNGKYPFGSIFKIKIESHKEIKAPSYFFYPDASIEAKIQAAKKQYGLD